MYGDTTNLDEVRKKLNSVSPSFCMAKWMHTTLHLMNGHTHSCYLPPIHKIPLKEIEKDPAALHNTSYKKEQRRKMKEGVRPEECQMCWAIEDLPGNQVSDRILRGTDSWTVPYFEQVKNMPWDQNINPSYVEVSFSSVCNFKCSYCSPHVSTKWNEEIKQYGPYKLSTTFQDTKYLKKAGLMPFEDEENNPYLKAFWEWWPELAKSLTTFRITGGEPLLSKDTFKILDWLNANPTPIDLDINSNLGIAEGVFHNFLSKAKPLVAEKKVKALRIHTSIDTYGAQAEYIRHGLNFEKFQKNLRTYLEEIPNGGVAFMCTFNALSVVGFQKFLSWYKEIRQQYENEHRDIYLDIPHLSSPAHQSVRILTPEYGERILEIIDWMESSGFRPMEIAKLKRVYQWMTVEQKDSELKRNRKDFYQFFTEHDRRRGTRFLNVFPEMEPFWRLCEGL